MLERNDLMSELWSRLASTDGVRYTARNPSVEPNISDMPAIQFFELTDSVIESARRGAYVAYKRRLLVAVEVMVSADSEAEATQALAEFVTRVKKAIYAGGPTLGRRNCLIKEVESGRVLRPPVGNNLAGLGMIFEVIYTEDINQLFLGGGK